MATSFPSGLDALTNPVSTDTLASPSHADQHGNVNDAVEALEAKVGVNSSAVTSSLDYKIVNIPATSITTGTLDNARLPAAATNITSVGTLTGLRVDGTVGIGGAAPAYAKINVSGTLPSSSNLTQVFRSSGTIPSTTTNEAWGYLSALSTQEASFTLGTLLHFSVDPGAFGAGSTVTTQRGFSVGSTLTGASYNYGFFSDIASGTNRFNLYMNGTAANYMAGRLGVGAVLTSGAMAQVTNTTAADKAFIVKGAASQTGNLLDIQNSSGTSLFTVTDIGNLNVASNVTTGDSTVQIGTGRTGNGYAYVDFIGDTTYTDYGLRIFRGNTGANATSQLAHRGTGNFEFTAFEAAPLIFSTTDAERMRIDPTGNLLVGMTTIATSSAKTIHIGNGTAPTANPASGGVLYVESGALKYRGSSGTVTTIANA